MLCRLMSDVGRKRRGETGLGYHLRVMCELLSCPRWRRLPLTVRWLRQEYRMDWPPGKGPPPHMGLAYGPLRVGVREREPRNKRGSKIPGNGAHCAICLQEFTVN
eukprot:g11134.t1